MFFLPLAKGIMTYITLADGAIFDKLERRDFPYSYGAEIGDFVYNIHRSLTSFLITWIVAMKSNKKLGKYQEYVQYPPTTMLGLLVLFPANWHFKRIQSNV